MRNITSFVLVAMFLFLVAGCNQSGVNSASADSIAAAVADPGNGGDNWTDPGNGGGDVGNTVVDPGNGGGNGTGNVVAFVHHPEPTTMLLWGAGLLGAAVLKRRKKV